MRKIFLLQTTFFIILAPSLVWAFSISPVKTVVTVDPGGTQTIFVTLKDAKLISKKYTVRIFGVRQDAQGKILFENNIDEAEMWVRPENPFIFLDKQNTTDKVNFFIQVPANTPPGSHFVGLAFEPSRSDGQGVNINTRLISLVKVVVSGTAKESLRISKWSAENIYKNQDKINFKAELRNLGNVGVASMGKILIKDWKNKLIYEENVNIGGEILAGSMREIKPFFEKYKAVGPPGLYKAELDIQYGLTQQKTSSVASFWYMPWWSWLILAIMLLCLCILLAALVRKWRKYRRAYRTNFFKP